MARPLKGPDENTYSGRVAARLKLFRVRSGMDQEKAAKAITKAGWPVSTPTIYRWEQGTSSPDFDALPVIAQAYNCGSVHSLLPKQ